MSNHINSLSNQFDGWYRLHICPLPVPPAIEGRGETGDPVSTNDIFLPVTPRGKKGLFGNSMGKTGMVVNHDREGSNALKAPLSTLCITSCIQDGTHMGAKLEVKGL